MEELYILLLSTFSLVMRTQGIGEVKDLNFDDSTVILNLIKIFNLFKTKQL